MLLAVASTALLAAIAAIAVLTLHLARKPLWRAQTRDWARRLLVEDPADVFNWCQRIWTWHQAALWALVAVVAAPFVALWLIDPVGALCFALVAWVGTGWWRQHIKRRFVKACRFAHVEQVHLDPGRDESSGPGAEHKKVVAREKHRPPRLQCVRRTEIGWAGQVRAPRGQDLSFVVKRRSDIAATLGVRAIHVDVRDDNPRMGDIVVVRDDPFPPGTPWPWPVLAGKLRATDLWDAVPFGRDELGRQVDLALPYSNFLLGGVPDAGKSASAALVLCWAALDPKVPLYIIDGAESDMAPFKPLIERTGVGRYVGDDVVEAQRLLEELVQVVKHRQSLLAGDDEGLRELLERDDEHADREIAAVWRRKVARGDAEPLILFVCDEWGGLVDQLHGHARDRFNELSRFVVSKGRKVGVVCMFSTQKPAHEVVPTSIRDLFRLRFALLSMTAAMSDMILGEWSPLGYNAATDIPPGHPGMGLLHANSRLPQRIRSYYIDDVGIVRVARAALELRTAYLEEHGHSGLGLGLVGRSRSRVRGERTGGVKVGQGGSGRVVVDSGGSAVVVDGDGDGSGHRVVRRGGGLPKGRRPL
jgi:S-DNA-T family DNA segregation ATPase FtsK/SpoIIIE